MIGSTYNANLQIFENDSSLVIAHEMIHSARMIPFDGRPHLPESVRQLGGDSRGQWEGDTLVVDTTNFTDKTNFRGPPAHTRQDIFTSKELHVVERFTRVDAETIVYRFTVQDPGTWTKQWSGEVLLKRFEGPIFEYACHEGNYGMANILAGARAKEKAVEAASSNPAPSCDPLSTSLTTLGRPVQSTSSRKTYYPSVLLEVAMSCACRAESVLVASAFAIAMFGAVAQAQQTRYAKPTELPNPYRLVEGWPTLPKSMNGGRWGEVIRVHVNSDGNIWVFHRCFNTVPPGHATCVGRRDSNPPILEFDPSGKLLKSFGVGLFAYPHGFTIDGDGNLWVSDVNDEATVLGMSAKNADGVARGQEVLKLSPAGKVLMMIGKEGMSGNGPDTFDRPTGVAVAPNGDVFITDGHMPNKHNSGRVVKFSKDGRFIKTWGHKGAAPGDFDEPHDLFIGGSEGHVYVADRRNNRVQVFDQDGNFIAAWKQFGQRAQAQRR
jgi:hypothetical protein